MEDHRASAEILRIVAFTLHPLLDILCRMLFLVLNFVLGIVVIEMVYEGHLVLDWA